MRKPATRTVILLATAGACSAAPPPPPPPPPLVAEAPPDAGATPAREPAIVAVVAAKAPGQVTVDGDLSEWGVLPTPVPSVHRPSSPDEKDLPPNPPEAASRLALAVTGEAAFVAAELDDEARRGFWLGIGAHVPALPPLGQRWNRMVGFVRLQCEYELKCWENPSGATVCELDTEKPLAPEAIEICKKLLRDHEALVAQHARRFQRIFRVDQDGLRVLAPSGELTPVPGARHAWRPRAKGATVELAIPLGALPRVAEAPLEALTLLARTVSGPSPPDVPPDGWVRVVLPEPVSFEPYGSLRAEVFDRQRRGDQHSPEGHLWYPKDLGLAMSYQPGDPLHFEAMDFEDDHVTAITPSEHTIYEKAGTLGDVEVGVVDHVDDWRGHLAVWKGGEPVRTVEIPGRIQRVLTRDGELHVLAFATENFYHDQYWSGVAVGPDGELREGLVEPIWSGVGPDGEHGEGLGEPVVLRDVPGEPQFNWSHITPFPSPDMETFGWRAEKPTRAVEVTWRWDPGRRLYRVRERALPPPRRKPAPRKAAAKK